MFTKIMLKKKISDKQSLGAEFKKIRLKKKISIYSITKSCGLSHQKVNEIEAGKRNYGIDTLLKYLDCIGMGFILIGGGGAGQTNNSNLNGGGVSGNTNNSGVYEVIVGGG